MADGKITIETSIDNAGALKDLNKLINKVNAQGTREAGKTAKIFSVIGKTASAAMSVAATSIGTVSAALVAAGGVAVKTGIDFESAFAGVKKTVDAPNEVIEQLRQSLINMSKEMPQSASELAGIAEAAGQLGIETQNIENFTKTMAQLGDATNMIATEAADSLARFANITGMSQEDFDRLGSTIVALGNNLATTESEITEMGMRLAGAGHQVGMSESQIMSFAAALSSVGINAEAGGSAFSSVMAKMQLATEKGGDELREFADVAGMSSQEFKTAFEKDAAGAIIAFIDGLSKCESQGKSAIGVLDNMGITEITQRDALLRAAGAADVFTDALNIGTSAWQDNTDLANEAAQRYETLESKLDMMKNSAAALGIQFKDSIDGNLRNAVQIGTDSINRLSAAFTEGGLDAAVTEAGDIIADLAVRIAGSAPDMIQSASTLLSSFVNGIASHKGEIINAGIEVAKELGHGIADLLPESMGKPAKEAIDTLAKSLQSGGLKKAAGDVVNIFKNMATLASKALKPAAEVIDLLADHFDKLAPIAAGAYVAISGRGKINMAVSSVKSLVDGVKKMTSWYERARIVTAAYALQEEIATYTGRKRTVELTAGQAIVGLFTGKVQLATAAQTVWNAVTAANPIGLLVTAVAAAAAAIGIFALTSQDSTTAVNEETNALAENAEQIRETQAARQETIEGISQEYGHYQQLWEELKGIVDENGRVKAGYEDRASFITSTLSDALGIEISMTDGVIDKYGELKGSIDEIIEKKKQQAILDAYYDSYTEAIKNQADANKDLAAAYAELEKAKKNAKTAEDELKEANVTSGYLYDQLKGKVDSANAKLKDAEDVYGNAKVAADEYNNTISNYEAASGAVLSGSENVNSALMLLTNNMKTAGTATQEELAKQAESYRTEFENMRAAAATGGSQVSQQMVEDAQMAYLLASEQMMIGSGMTQEQVQIAMERLAEQIGASGVPAAAGTEATETTSAMSNTLAAGATEVQAGADTMTAGAETTIANTDLPSAGASAASGTGTAMGNTLRGEAPVAGAAASYLVDIATKGFSNGNLPAASQSKGKEGGVSMAEGMQSQSGTVGESATLLIDTVKKAFSAGDLANYSLTEGKTFGQSLANGMNSQSEVVGTAAGVLVSSIKTAVSGLADDGKEAGGQFSSGLATGIRNGAAGVSAAAAEVARKAVESAKANLDINSPSKVMEEVGYWYDEGLGGGIRKYGDHVIQAVDNLVSELLLSPRQMARSVQSAFDGNIMRIAERYASAQNRIPGESAAEMDYIRLAELFAEKVMERLGMLSIEVDQREFGRLVREVTDHVF